MKKYLIIGIFVILSCTGILISYLDNKEETVPAKTAVKETVTSERSIYEEAEKALSVWEHGNKKNEIEAAYCDILEKNIGKLRAENPYVVNMREAVDIKKLAIPKEITVEKDKKLLRNADTFVYAGKTYDAGYYRKDKDKTVKYFLEQEGGKKPQEIKLEGMLHAALYGFKTIKLFKSGTPLLMAMMFANDDSWSTRNFYIMGRDGNFVKIFSFEGAWVEERYADIDGDKVLEMILQRRLNWEPAGAAEIVKGLKEKNLTGFNAIFYEHEIIKWDEKGAKLVKAGSIFKADFSHKE
ncbi:MAG: hypothetical protein A2231_09315 [Candidatus Firestonebacteria bacterium RIFOXYA2_FULL_40_8]|nr:MAG: hypothetical protein A2231_09315 [Candidatus Firestonebacteria bacterium RIFOXYA2_FULL_40_8]